MAPAAIPMIPRALAIEAGPPPIRRGPVRFAIGSPDGFTSNAWRMWTSKRGDIYIACRDNFKEAKVSLHASGRWRMGLTTEAVEKNTRLLSSDENRAWEVWDKPAEVLPGLVIALHLVFPTSELAVRPDLRRLAEWKDVVFIEAAPPGTGVLTLVTLFVTRGDPDLLPSSGEPSFRLASLDIGENRRAQLVACVAPEANIPKIIADCVAGARKSAESQGIELPKEAYGYFFGRRDDGSRFLVGALVGSLRDLAG
jgi:hypothetical protein